MKKFLLLLIIPFLSFSQYSTYYGTYSVNVNSTVNSNVTKTITTIDYAELAKANALREKNQIENLKFQNEKEKRERLEIASNPHRAVDYGTKKTHVVNRSLAYQENLKSLKFGYTLPHNSLFKLGQYNWVNNESENDITTRIELIPSYRSLYDYKAQRVDKQVLTRDEEFFKKNNGEEYIKTRMSYYKVGEVQSDSARNYSGKFIHKTDINRINFCGNDAYVMTIIWEDDYQKGIDDIYISVVFDEDLTNGANYILESKVEYRATNDVSFEDIEGRRYYFRRLVKTLFQVLTVSYEPIIYKNKEGSSYINTHLGFVFSPNSVNETRTFYGFNLFWINEKSKIGPYLDFRFNTKSKAHIMNFGIISRVLKIKKTYLSGHLGIGYARYAIRSGFDSESTSDSALWDRENNQQVYDNYNFGLIIKIPSLSFQIGYDTSLPKNTGLILGVGLIF